MPGLEYDVKFRTHLARRRVQDLVNMVELQATDPKRERRIKDNECVACFYQTHIVGHMFTPYTCEICAGVQNWPNTATPRMCDTCAYKHSICRRCGADRELNESRNELICANHVPYVTET